MRARARSRAHTDQTKNNRCAKRQAEQSRTANSKTTWQAASAWPAWPGHAVLQQQQQNALHIWQISEHWTHWTHWFISSDSRTKEGRRREREKEKKTCDDDVVYRLEKWVRSFAGTATHTHTYIRSFAVLLHSNFHVNPFGRFVVIIVKLFYAYFSARLISHLIPFFHSSVHVLLLLVFSVFSLRTFAYPIHSDSHTHTHTTRMLLEQWRKRNNRWFKQKNSQNENK